MSPYISVIDALILANRAGGDCGGFDELRKAMRQHGNINYVNIWIGSLTWLKHKASIQPFTQYSPLPQARSQW